MNKEFENEKYLEFLCNLAPMLQKLIPLDCIIGIADTEKILQSLPGKNISLPTNNDGMLLPKEAPITRAIRENKPVKVITPASVFGLEYQGTAIPIYDLEGNVIGGMGLGVGLEKKEVVSKNANQVADPSEFVRKNVENLSVSAQELSEKQQKLLELTHTITNQINETEKIIQIDNEVNQTTLIGHSQALATKELSNAVFELSETSKILQDASKDIVG